jgi:hypothetical protein
MAKLDALNEKTVWGLPVPERGNKPYRCGGCIVQGFRAPTGMMVIVASDHRSYALAYRAAGIERRMVIDACGDWSAVDAVKEARPLRQASTGAKTR